MRVKAVSGYRHPSPASRPADPFLLYEPGNGAPRDTNAAIPQLGMDPRGTAAPLALQDDRFDLAPNTFAPGSTLDPLWRSTLPSIIAAAGDAYDPTHEPDGVLESLGNDDGEFCLHVVVATVRKKLRPCAAPQPSSFGRLLSQRSCAGYAAAACWVAIAAAKFGASS